ncbi:MAG: hypothetical protein GVY36_10385 [Verrucomicrobia bacterium]|nr:hypothetical protein [Verrucomicrobiota bacterium]
MKFSPRFVLLAACICLASLNLSAQETDPKVIIDRARATVGTESALDNLVTLRLVGRLEPADRKMPSATILIVARKPCCQRMEIRVDDIVETTILKGNKACIIRSNLNAEASQMRELTGPELDRIRYSTRQFFKYYRPDHRRGEKVSLAGIEPRHGKRCYKLSYRFPDGLETIRFFSLEDDQLVSTVSGNGVESIGLGERIVDGIKFPERIEYHEDDRKLHSIIFEEILVNQPLAAGIFDIPGQDGKSN